MAQVIPAQLEAHFDIGQVAAAGAQPRSPAAGLGAMTIAVYEDLSAVEHDWRALERHADSTVFQSFDWLAIWQRHIGVRNGVRPAIVVTRDSAGTILFLLPLSVRTRGFARSLAWLGSENCDYNAPLLAKAFSAHVDREHFMALWGTIVSSLRNNPHLRFDFVDLEKMPETVGEQQNPMCHLGGNLTPSGAYLTHFSGDWETFYAAKRSSATRRRDRTKRKKLAEFGAVNLVNPASHDEILRTADILMVQKARQFAHMGVGNLFARPGYAEFYRAIATDPATKHLAHVSRFDVGTTAAAVNLGLTWRGCYYHLLASYADGELSHLGPGAAHLHELMHYAIDRGFKVFDFTIGDERYKRDWCDTELKLYDYVSAAAWRGAIAATLLLAARRLKRLIKQTPVLWGAFSKGRALSGSLAQSLRG